MAIMCYSFLKVNPDFVRQLNTYYQIIEPILKHIVVRFEGDVEKLTSASDTTKSQEDTSEEDSPGDSPLEDVESKAENADEDVDVGNTADAP